MNKSDRTDSKRWLNAMAEWKQATNGMMDILVELKTEVDRQYFVAGAGDDMDTLGDLDNLRNRIENAQRETSRGLGRMDTYIEEVDEGLAAVWW